MTDRNLKARRVIRPAATVGFTYMITLLAASALPTAVSCCFFIVGLAVSIVISLIRKLRSQRLLLLLLTASIACGAYAIYTLCNYLPALQLDGKSLPITATVTDVADNGDGTTQITVALDSTIIDTPIPVKARLYPNEAGAFKPADRIRTTVKFYLPSAQFGTYSPLESSRADGIFLYGSLKTEKTILSRPNEFQLSAWLYDFRQSIKGKINTLLNGETARVFQGMLLGDNSAISDTTYRDFLKTGILHVMVVSGLHLTILCQFLASAMQAVGISRKKRAVVIIAILPFFMAVAGFTPSVNRAGMMLILFHGATLFRREADSLTSIGIIGLLFTLFQPYLVTDLGFQLTYLSTLGIVLFAGPMAEAIQKKVKLKNPLLQYINATFWVTPAAMVLTLPITALQFQGLPILSAFFNLLLSPVFSAVLSLGLLMILFSALPILSVVAQGLAAVVSILVDLIRYCSALCGEIPFSYLPLGYRFVYFWIIGSILVFTVAYFCRNRRVYLRIVSAICAGVFLCCSIGFYALNQSSLTLAICTEGSKSSVVFACRDQMILLDCNQTALRLADTTHLRKIPFISAEQNLAAIAEYANDYQIDTLCTDTVLSPEAIACREVLAPTNAVCRFDLPITLTIRKTKENVYYQMVYRDYNIIYGEYDETFLQLHDDEKENIYILTNDFNSVFQKPTRCVILLNGIPKEIEKQNPNVTFVDGSAQGITPMRLGPDPAIRIKGAGRWLF